MRIPKEWEICFSSQMFFWVDYNLKIFLDKLSKPPFDLFCRRYGCYSIPRSHWYCRCTLWINVCTGPSAPWSFAFQSVTPRWAAPAKPALLCFHRPAFLPISVDHIKSIYALQWTSWIRYSFVLSFYQILVGLLFSFFRFSFSVVCVCVVCLLLVFLLYIINIAFIETLQKSDCLSNEWKHGGNRMLFIIWSVLWKAWKNSFAQAYY